MIREKKKWLEWITFPNCDELLLGFKKVYLQSSCKKFIPFYIRVPFSTLIIDLSASEEQLLSSYKPVARYEIRRGVKDGLEVWYDQDVHSVIELFKLTAKAKGLNQLDEAIFLSKPAFIVSHISRPGTGELAAHFYLLDTARRRVLLYYNCSAYRKFEKASLRSLCGRANRYLFHSDFLYFKEKGFTTYDFGGYNPSSSDPSLRPVNKFKETLGGEVEQQFNYYPLWYWLFRKIRQKWTAG